MPAAVARRVCRPAPQRLPARPPAALDARLQDNPNVWVEPQMDLSGTYWYPPGTVVTAKTPLAPFRVPGKRRFFTSDDMRSWRALGYE